MSSLPSFTEKLSTLLFLEINKEKFEERFGVKVMGDIHLPIRLQRVSDRVREQGDVANIPIGFFLEGMFYLLGADPSFTYNNTYEIVINQIQDSTRFIKGVIFEEVKREAYVDAYLLLKGLTTIEKNKENYERLILLAEQLRVEQKEFKVEELDVIRRALELEEWPLPYLYEAILRKEEAHYEKALQSITKYLELGGEGTAEVLELKYMLKNSSDYDNGKEILYEDPKKALSLLLPLLEVMADHASLYYYIAVAYRILENHEKAIYYLNESLAVDSALAEPVNELGINYACLGQFDTAIAYLRKAFEATKSIEICTNLIMCYINSGNLDGAKKHLAIAKKLDPKDEIVIELDTLLSKEI